MILDIVQLVDGKDLGLSQSNIPKAANLVAVQLGDLEYAIDFGLDKKYFLTSQINFQKANFRSYVVQRLSENQISVNEVVELLRALSTSFTYRLGTQNYNVRGLIK